jgi:hypothetical protein
MKSFASYLFITCCVINLLAVDAWSTDLGAKTRSQESVRGYLVDTICVREEAAQLAELGLKHTRKCLAMPACRESGYALLLSSNNNVLHFDKRGNDLAARLVNGHRAESGWLLRATGKRTGSQFAVTTLEFVSKASLKQRK